MKELNMPMTVQACGIEEETYFAAIERLALDAFDDQCTPANPRLPLVSELVQIYKDINVHILGKVLGKLSDYIRKDE